MKKDYPLINCHVHIFTGDHVPPYLGKSILPLRTWWLLNFQWVFAGFRWWYSGPGKKRYGGKANQKKKKKFEREARIVRNTFLNGIRFVSGLYFAISTVDIVTHNISHRAAPPAGVEFCSSHLLSPVPYVRDAFVHPHRWWAQIIVVLITLLCFKSGRNMVWFLLKQVYKPLQQLPGKQTKELFERYLLIGRYSFHQSQATTFNQLRNQYPTGTGFVVLPMDMAFMEAGQPAEDYYTQMQKLARIKKSSNNQMLPFVFVDPRRIRSDKNFFRYRVENGDVILEDCFLKQYLEEYKFSGIKIYPALGYYPFDADLLPLWVYAQKNKIPIMTHCVRGPMFFRGKKEKEWDQHPVFKQSTGTGVMDKLLLPELKNDKFSTNFTHPLNYLCLLKKEWLRKVVNQAYTKSKDERLIQLFGLTPHENDDNATITTGLENLKICLAHFGGNDEWEKYLERDRYTYSNELATNPVTGIDFLHKKGTTNPSPGKMELLWKYGDWYSIICSILLQHPSMYTDVSYILHNDDGTLPLLQQTLRNPKLRRQILFGTDFYVVRNHKSDKHMLAEIQGGLHEDEFNQIALDNPKKYLNIP